MGKILISLVHTSAMTLCCLQRVKGTQLLHTHGFTLGYWDTRVLRNTTTHWSDTA